MSTDSDGYHKCMEMANIEMHQPMPEIHIHEVKRKSRHKNTIHDIQDILLDLCDQVNTPEWLPEIIYSFYRYHQRKGYLTEGQNRVLSQIYRGLCWEGIFEDPNHYIHWH